MRMLMAVGMSLALLGLGGCSSVQSNVSVFHTADVEKPNTFTVKPTPVLQGSLQAQTYAALIADALEAKGWSEVKSNAEVEVVFAYAIDNGTTHTSVAPIYGQTGGGSTQTFGTVSGGGGFATYSGTTYTTPTYGVVGAVPVTNTVYNRAFVLDMYKRKDGTKVYESRVTSQGSSGSIDLVAKCLISALFEDFPGKSGQHRTVTVDFDTCKIS